MNLLWQIFWANFQCKILQIKSNLVGGKIPVMDRANLVIMYKLTPCTVRYRKISFIALVPELLERQELRVTLVKNDPRRNAGITAKGDATDSPDGYITRLDKFGNIQKVPINFAEAAVEDEPNPLADFMSTDILAKPFNFVSGNVSKSRFNPFRKKSGLLNVLARQATKNRIVAKNGMLNTVGSADGKKHKFFKDIFISLIDLNWGWIFLLFAAGFFLSWLAFAVVWYLTFLVHGDLDPVNQVPFQPAYATITVYH